MADLEENQKNDFLIEKFKDRPVNKKKLLRRTMTTAGMAVIFGLVACITFLVLEPLISKWLYPEEEPQMVVFPQDQEEMSPEEMLSDNMQIENQANQIVEIMENVTLDKEQLQAILSNIVLNKENYRQIYSSLSDYVNELNKCMVTVTGVTSNIDWFNNVETSSNQASGVIVANNGRQLIVLVNSAPLRKTERLILTFYNGTQVDAEWKKENADTDLAIVTVDLSMLDKELAEDERLVATLGSSNNKFIVSTPVIALGSPMGNSGSVGYGMITSSNAQNSIADTNYKLLQTDIYGSQNAGGVLFNLYGQVVGIITSNKSGSDMKNLVNAYGISELKTLIEKMSNGQEMAYLGICGMDVTREAHEELNVPYGAFVKEVDMDSPSMLAGIQQGDVLVQIDEKPILGYGEYASTIAQLEPDQQIEITIMRQVQAEYKEMKFKVVLGKVK